MEVIMEIGSQQTCGYAPPSIAAAAPVLPKVRISTDPPPITAASVVYGYPGNIQVFRTFDGEIMLEAWKLIRRWGTARAPVLIVVTEDRVLHAV